MASLVAPMVKNPPAMQETQVWSQGWEDPLEKEMVTHSSILAWRIPWTEEPNRLQSMESQRVGHDWVTNILYCISQVSLVVKNSPANAEDLRDTSWIFGLGRCLDQEGMATQSSILAWIIPWTEEPGGL